MAKVLQDGTGNESSKRWFAAGCFVAAVGLAGASLFPKLGVETEVIKAFLWPATIVLVGGTAAEQIKDMQFGGTK